MMITVDQLAARLGGEVIGDREREIARRESIAQGEFRRHHVRRGRSQFAEARSVPGRDRAGGCREITHGSPVDLALHSVSFIVVADPQAAFIETILLFRPLRSRSQIGISLRPT